MDILKFGFPNEIYIGQKAYKVNTSFRNWIKIDEIISDDKKKMEEKIPQMLFLCYKKLPPSLDSALEGLYSFYLCGDKIKAKEKEEASVKFFDFTSDGELIYSAFFSQYKIDLAYEDIHWWKFIALFKGLDKSHLFCQVLFYRQVNLFDIKDKEKRAFYRKMKNLYRLSDKRSEEEKSAEIAKTISSLF